MSVTNALAYFSAATVKKFIRMAPEERECLKSGKIWGEN